MAKCPAKTWIVVADGARAHLQRLTQRRTPRIRAATRLSQARETSLHGHAGRRTGRCLRPARFRRSHPGGAPPKPGRIARSPVQARTGKPAPGGRQGLDRRSAQPAAPSVAVLAGREDRIPSPQAAAAAAPSSIASPLRGGSDPTRSRRGSRRAAEDVAAYLARRL